MNFLVFLLGGLTYTLIELIYRNHTHWSMFIVGGCVMFTLYLLLPFLWRRNIFLAALYAATIITLYEFFAGLIFNLWLKLNVWDYSALPGNLLGQICPLFSFYWFFLCFIFFFMLKCIVYIL